MGTKKLTLPKAILYKLPDSTYSNIIAEIDPYNPQTINLTAAFSKWGIKKTPLRKQGRTWAQQGTCIQTNL